MKENRILNQFFKGFKGDYVDDVEEPQSYVTAVNGRLYSHNGIIAYSSVKGTQKAYENQNIVSYHGFYAFRDELIIFVKALPAIGIQNGGTVEYQHIKKIIAKSFETAMPYNNSSILINLTPHVTTFEYDTPVYVPAEDPFGFNTNISCVSNTDVEIDYSEYFTENNDVENLQICPINNESNLFENNIDYVDVIISLKKDDNNNIYDQVLWSGFQNWPLDAKIIAQGVDENKNLRRIYYTDYVNVFRMMNTKDANLKYKKFYEFDLFQNVALLQPEIELIDESGRIKASTVFYTYRLYTANGQQTEFSPFSEGVKILKNNGVLYAGGDISEITNKRVHIKLNIPSYAKYQEVELFAVEYEASGSPTAIRTLGVLPSAPIVKFTHSGDENEFSSGITLPDLINPASNWRYCSDILTSRNKMLVSGLRNEPIPPSLSRITEDFSLHGWDATGLSHNCIINPKPYKYKYIDPSFTGDLYYINKKVYETINVFGSCTVFIKNTITNESFSHLFLTDSTDYRNLILEMYDWLVTIKDTHEFEAVFINLSVLLIDDKIVFQPTVDSLETNMNQYIFNYSTSQVVENIKKQIEFKPVTINASKLVYGGVSLGFNNGNGIRITFKTEEFELMSKSTSDDMARLLNVNEPDSKKGFMKGEIYRLGIQATDVKGNQLFTIPIGDIMVPMIGDPKKYLSNNGTAVIKSETYRNSFIKNDKLYSEKITMKVEVRLSCELQKIIDTYQLVYVERTEENRTILAQGLSAPMERIRRFVHTEFIQLNDECNDKWNLPYYGGPSYDYLGLKTYDNHGADYDLDRENLLDRIVTNRKMIYFDAPDIIHSIISPSLIKSGNIVRVAKLNTDHMPRNSMRSSGLGFGSTSLFTLPENWYPITQYPTFSRKIQYPKMDYLDLDYVPNFLNVSVFASERKGLSQLVPIKQAVSLAEGELVGGYKFESQFDISNNAFLMTKQPWFYSTYARRDENCPGYADGSKSELFNCNNFSPGASTIVISSMQEIFSDEFIDMAPIAISGEIHQGYVGASTYDTHALVNIQLNNLDTVYGGRSELAFSKNVYVALSKVIPVLKTSNSSQSFDVHGDTYCSLFFRNKNSIRTVKDRGKRRMYNNGGCNGYIWDEYPRFGAWYYACVVESSIETRWSYKESILKDTAPFDITKKVEEINNAYLQANSPKHFSPKPYRFTDNPDMTNTIAVSDVKINGSFFDAWSKFRVNNFYEIDKDKGAILNLAKYLDNVYAIQEKQQSLLTLDAQTMVNADNGGFQVQQGDGNSITNHAVVSDFGTSIRRAVVDIVSNTEKVKGFSFFDENKIEFIRITNPLLVENNLHLKFFELIKNDPITDTFGYYDDEYKETNIRIRTKSGLGFILSYNEIFGVFNGYIEYDNDVYLTWNQEVYAPKTTMVPKENTPGQQRKSSKDLHQLNTGNYLNFFDLQKTIKLGVLVNKNSETVKIYPHWSGYINTEYPIKQLILKTSLNQLRTVLGNHGRYNIREGVHSVPLKNNTDWEDLRGSWMYLEIEIESINNKKIDIYSFINFVRESYL